MSGALKVGFLVVVFCAMLVGAYTVLGRSMFAAKTDLYFAEFSDAAGIPVGAKVQLAGVNVGKVTKVELANPRLARLTLEVTQGTPIPEGSMVGVTASLISLGDMPVSIQTPANPSTALLKPGSTMVGRRIGALEGMLPESKQTFAELNKTLESTRKLIEDRGLRDDIRGLIESGNKTMAQFGQLAARVETLVAETRPAIKDVLVSATHTMTEVQRGVKMATDLVADPKMKDQVTQLMDRLDKIGAKTEQLVANLNDFVNDPGLRDPLRQTASNVQAITDSGKSIAESGKTIAANTEAMTKNGITITEKAIQLAEKANELADEAKTVIVRLQKFFDRVPDKVSLANPEITMDVLRDNQPGRWRTDVNASFQLADGRLHLGVYDAFETNKINLQFGKALSPAIEYRYGVYASKPGIGVDYRLAPNLSLRGDVFDMNSPRLDLRARLNLGNDWVGWIGMNRVFQRSSSPTFGIGIRK